MSIIRKAVFPVAGMGTRFLPATKANPKEMMPIVDKPLIQYAVEEAVSAGITEMIFVTSSSKRAIEDHFDKNYELESRLEKAGKLRLLEIARNIVPEHINCNYIRQKEPNGLGHAVLCAKNIIGDEPFAVLLADDLMLSSSKNCLEQMVEKFSYAPTSMIAVEEIQPQDSDKYGVVKVDKSTKDLVPLQSIVEKPTPEQAPSNLGVAGRYILTPEIFTYLEMAQKGAGGEIQLTDAIAGLLTKETVNIYKFQGKRYDCGSKLGYIKATIRCALEHPEIKQDVKKFLEQYAMINEYEL